ncbi:MAG: DUF3467 domain-containing protein [Candidatus Syntropharchaeia archaeon]
MSAQQSKFIRKRSDKFRVIYQDALFGGHRSDHFEMTVQSIYVNAAETQESGRNTIDVVDEVCIKMSPQQAKSTMLWFMDHIKRYEEQFGEIKLQTEPEKPTKDVMYR